MRLLVYLPRINDQTFLLFTWKESSDGACLRDYSRGPEVRPSEDRSRSASEIRKLLEFSGAVQLGAEHRSTDEVGYWFAVVDQLNREHELPGRSGVAIPVAATHGSQYWIQRCVNEQPRELNDLIIGASPTIAAFKPLVFKWKSPLVGEGYREYRDGFLQALGLENHLDARRRFWPKTGPQWDALASVQNDQADKGVLLVEAKAHPNESFGDGCDADGESIELIARSLEMVKAFCDVPIKFDWLGRIYQTANRFAFLYFLNEVCRVPTWLVFVNFVGDLSHHPTSMAQWAEHYPRLFRELGLGPRSPLLDRAAMVFQDVARPATSTSSPLR